MNRAVANFTALLLAAVLVNASFPTVALGQTPVQTNSTLPSSESVRSLLMNNWTDTVGVHYSRQLYPADKELFGPYLEALHRAGDWPTNQIGGAMAFFRADVRNENGTASEEQPTGPDQPPS